MKAAQQHQVRSKRRNSATLLLSLLTILTATSALAGSQLVLKRGDHNEHNGALTGVIDLAIDPGFDNAKVTVTVDGQKVADGLRSPYHVMVDFGPTALQHKITV